MIKNILLTLIIISCVAFVTPKVYSTDYRDSYVGNYFCSVNCVRDSVGSDTLTLTITKDISDSILNVSLRNSIYKFKLKNNIMLSFSSGTHGQGNFFSDSLSLGISTSLSAGVCMYKGKKQ